MRSVLAKLYARVLAVVIAVAVAMVGLPVFAALSPERATAAPSVESMTEAPDSIAAMVGARASGQRVEDLSQRTETGRVFADPSGTWTAEATPEPVRVQDPAGNWQDIDTSLVAEEHGLVPAAAAGDVVFSDGGDRTFVRVREDGRTMDWRWTSVLPAPVVDGDTATYEGVAAGGGDLVVTATATGFTHSVVLHEAPAGPVEFTTPILSQGAEVVEAAGGGVAVETAAGDTLVSAPAPLMWDSSQDAGGLPVHVENVDTSIGETAAGTPTLTLTPDTTFLNDPSTVYPVTVDPSFTTTVTSDTWVQYPNYTSSQLSTDELRTGTYDGEHKARTFMQFRDTAWNGKHVLSANLKMLNWHSRNCIASATNVYAATQDWSGATLTWANQPAGDPSTLASYAGAHGTTGCPDSDATWDITDIVSSWADGTRPNYGLRLRANNETDVNSWRRYWSVNYTGYTTGQAPPRIEYTYNSYPGRPWTPTVAPGTWYAPPSATSSSLYVADRTPKLTSKAREYDGGLVRMVFEVYNSSTMTTSSKVSGCTTGYVASLSKASCSISTPLADGAKYWVRSYSDDGTDQSLDRPADQWSEVTSFTVAEAAPAQPVVNCAGYTNNTWTTAAPTNPVSCTITGAGSGETAPAYIAFFRDGGVEEVVKITRSISTTTAKTTTTLPATSGAHSIEATSISAAGVESAPVAFGFGSGQLALASPTSSKVTTTATTVGVDAAGPATGSTADPVASVKWRTAASGAGDATGWNTIDAADLSGLDIENKGAAGIRVTGIWDARDAVRDEVAGVDLDPRVPTLLEVQVCVTYPSSGQVCTWDQSKVKVLRVPHAFGDGYPTTEAGPGQAAMWTGEFSTEETDVTMPGYTGSLSISRSHASFNGPAGSTAVGVFGPGWTAHLDGPEAGAAGLEVYDNTLLDGTLSLVDGDGAGLTFRAPGTTLTRRSGSTLATGTWVAVDEDTTRAGVTADVSGSGTGTTLALVDAAGTTTRYRVTTAPSATEPAEFSVLEVAEAGAAGTTTYTRDGAGRVTRITAPTPPGVTCPATGTWGANAAGCRALAIDYASTTTAASGTPGDFAGQVKAVYADLYNPEKAGGAGMDHLKVAEYTYDTAGRMVTAKDTRSGLVTSYTYDGTSTRLATVTEPGLAAFELAYSSAERLTKVSRARPGGGTSTLAHLIYNIPVDGSGGSPDLGISTVSGWGQHSAPTHGFAVFGPDRQLASSDPAALTATDYKYAALSYTDDRGYTLNSAEYGAGAWQYTATAYDTYGNVTRELDTRDIAAIRDGAAAADLGTTTTYNSQVTALVDGVERVVLPAGNVVTDTYGPARYATRPNGEVAWLRPHTHYDYDQGAPNSGINPATGQRYALATTATTTAQDPATGADVDTVSTAKTGYDPLGSPTTAETDAFWAMGLATTSTTVMPGGTDIVARTRYDTAGRVTENRQPSSPNGADAGTRQVVYYTAGTNTDAAACGTKPEWAGSVCLTRYAGTASGGAALPVTQTTGYTAWLQPTTVTETVAGTLRRTTQTRYDAADRVAKTWTVANVSGSTFAPGVAYAYATATGLVTEEHATDATGTSTGTPVLTDYDTWGRPSTYTPATGETTSTSYDTAGRVATVTDPKGTTTYTYNGTDAHGQTEYRGLVTGLSVSNPTGRAVAFTGAYDPAGNLVTQTLPGGLTQTFDYDIAGEQIGLAYTGATTKADGTVGTGEWLAWTSENDVTGRTIRETTPTGAALGDSDQSLSAGTANAYDRAYRYDPAGRLVKVTDRTAPSGGGAVDDGDPATPDTPPTGTVCQIRDYTFDANGNRTSLTRTTGAASATCPTTGGVTKTSTYDAADRLITGYTYDTLGRVTTMPAADTPAAALNGTSVGNMTLGYYDNDLPRSITQVGATTTYSLDTVGRQSVSTHTPSGAPSTVTERHYTDRSDKPGWSSVTTGTGATAVTRYAHSLSGDLAAILSVAGVVTLPLVDPHGDTVTTSILPTSGNGTSLSEWVDSDEYGNPLGGATAASTGTNPNGSPSHPALNFGWLGGDERATDTTGLFTMGARLYNPVTGAFTSMDPVYGGGSSAYMYPTDPMNSADLDGNLWGALCRVLCKQVAKHGKKLAQKVASTAKALARTVARQAARAKREAIRRTAAWIQKHYMGGAQGTPRVVIERKGVGKWVYDLTGRSHGGVPTPHMYYNKYNPRAPNGYNRYTGPVKEMGWRDLWKVWRHLRR